MKFFINCISKKSCILLLVFLNLFLIILSANKLYSITLKGLTTELDLRLNIWRELEYNLKLNYPLNKWFLLRSDFGLQTPIGSYNYVVVNLELKYIMLGIGPILFFDRYNRNYDMQYGLAYEGRLGTAKGINLGIFITGGVNTHNNDVLLNGILELSANIYLSIARFYSLLSFYSFSSDYKDFIIDKIDYGESLNKYKFGLEIAPVKSKFLFGIAYQVLAYYSGFGNEDKLQEKFDFEGAGLSPMGSYKYDENWTFSIEATYYMNCKKKNFYYLYEDLFNDTESYSSKWQEVDKFLFDIELKVSYAFN